MLDRFSLRDQIMIATGASSGLGAGFARALAEAQADVVLAGRRADRLGQVTGLIKNIDQHAVAVTNDVNRPADCEALVSASIAEFGRVDVLVNNAGLGSAVPVLCESPGQFRDVVDVNLHGVYWMAQRPRR